MHVYLLQIDEQSLGKPGSLDAPRGSAAWQLLGRCETDSAESCLLLRKIVELGNSSKEDAKAVLAALDKLIRAAATGQPIESFYNKKQCHPLHEFVYKGRRHVIWRIRKGCVRIAFYYAQGKVIFLADALVKRRDKLSNGEKRQLEKEVKIYIDAEDAQRLLIISRQGECYAEK